MKPLEWHYKLPTEMVTMCGREYTYTSTHIELVTCENCLRVIEGRIRLARKTRNPGALVAKRKTGAGGHADKRRSKKTKQKSASARNEEW